ncbi:MAG: hypothetical protein OHK0052_13700 [Anaerolineales bacterium]
MEIEQILKKLDWLDEERRKDKAVIAGLQDRIQGYQTGIDLAHQQIKGLQAEIARLTTLLGRMDQYDENLLQVRIETKKRSDDIEKQFRKALEDAEKIRRTELRNIENDLAELRKGFDPIPELRRLLQARADDVIRIDRVLEELRQRIEDVRHGSEEFSRSYRIIEDSRRQDAKRLTDFVGEIAAIRKRGEENRAQIELASNTLRKLENRLLEIITEEDKRAEVQTDFLERQAVWQLERDRQWKDLQTRFENLDQQATLLFTQAQNMEVTHQSIRRTQEAVESVTERVERRINEITEIQRLGEERFRQEWVTFRADDQKRWTNYTLNQDEQRSEVIRQNEKLAERIIAIEDLIHELQDLQQQIAAQTGKRLQSLLALAHEWVSTYERSIGSSAR